MTCNKNCNQGRNCDCKSTGFEWTVIGVLVGALLLWAVDKFI